MAHTDFIADSAVEQGSLEIVFVYGSLKRTMANHRQMAGAAFAGTAVLQGLALYDLGPFPMAVASTGPDDRLWGELYRLNAQHLVALDRFEGTPRLYQRVRWPLGKGQQVWVYVGRPRQVRYVNRISSGCWIGGRGRTPELQNRSEGHQPAPDGGKGQGQH